MHKTISYKAPFFFDHPSSMIIYRFLSNLDARNIHEYLFFNREIRFLLAFYDQTHNSHCQLWFGIIFAIKAPHFKHVNIVYPFEKCLLSFIDQH